MKPHDLPHAPRTWSVWGALLAAEEATGPLILSLPRPALIVGCLPTIADSDSAGSGSGAALANLLMSLSESTGRIWTKQSTPGGITNASAYVDAAAYDTAERRALDLVLIGPSELIVEFRWKVPTLAAAFHNVIVGANFWGRYLTAAEASELLAEQEGDLR